MSAKPAEEEQPIGMGVTTVFTPPKRGSWAYIYQSAHNRKAKRISCQDKQAKDRFFRPVKEYADRQGDTERLEADKPLEWVQRMNHIRNAVGEAVNAYGREMKVY